MSRLLAGAPRPGSGAPVNGMETTGRVLEQIPYGLYVVGSLNGTVPVTMVANWVTQVSFSPPWVAMAVEMGSRMREYIGLSGVFSVNILPSGGRDVAKAFLKGPGAKGDTIGGRKFEAAKNGAPFLVDAVASFVPGHAHARSPRSCGLHRRGCRCAPAARGDRCADAA